MAIAGLALGYIGLFFLLGVILIVAADARVNVDRFPGVRDGWARFDGPAGTQMVDTAIAAMADWAASGSNANSGGAFAAADASDALLERARAMVGRAPRRRPDGICFGANMTTMTLAFTRAVAETLRPGRACRRHPARPRRQRVAVAHRLRRRRRRARARAVRPVDRAARPGTP